MRKFRFNLQRVLDYRQTVEDALLAELAAIQAEHARESARLTEMTHARDQFKERLKEQLAAGGPEDIKRGYAYLQQLAKQVSAQQALLRRIKERKDRKTQEVLEAAKERKALERLRDHKVNEHRRESERQEQKFLDDVGCIRYVHRKRGGNYAAGGSE